MRIFYSAAYRLFTTTMETKSPYFSPRKTRNYAKKEGLTLLQKATQGLNPQEKHASGKKPPARGFKAKDESNSAANGVAQEKPIKKVIKKRATNIRTDALAVVKNESVTKEKSDETVVAPLQGSEKTPEKQPDTNGDVEGGNEMMSTSSATIPETEVKIKVEPVDDIETAPQLTSSVLEKTPIKREPAGADHSPIKRELENGNTDDSTVAKESKWEPENWRQMMENIREMRKAHLAPVDTMGCDQFTQDSGATEVPDRVKRYHCLVSLILSSQTKDKANHECMLRLKKHGLTPESIVATDSAVLQKLIYPVGFYKNKTRFIKEMSQILIDQYGGDIPNSIEGLLKLPGVGKKMAHLCMRSAWNIVTGIGVDTHVHRIANWLKWVPKETKCPEDTRQALEKWLPYELWDEVNHLLVGFGQTICTSRFPRCNDCSNAPICPARGQQKIRNTPIKKEVKMEDLEF
uniref:Endonuclease III homolog n=1 Tax=Anopheles coluzzii TaxID=1518534 RepID=A0A6E8VB19_ANOCL